MTSFMERCLLILLGLGSLYGVISATDDAWLQTVTDGELLDDTFFFEERKNALPLLCKYDVDNLEIRNISCNFRGSVVQEMIFKWRASSECYMFLQPSLKDDLAPPIIPGSCIINGISSSIRCIYINSTTDCYPFDEDIPEVVREIRRTLISNVGLNKWISCSKNAMQCCNDLLAESTNESDFCPALWDAWSCWDKAPAGSSVLGVCPEHVYSNTGPSCHHFSVKQCFKNATWNERTNYGTCSITPLIITRIKFHIACLSVSLIVSLPAVVILFSYRKLRVRKLALHRNLLVAFMIRNILVIITKSTVLMDELTSSGDTIMSRNEWPCKLLASLEKLASNATFTCMLIDGFFLHRMIVTVFKSEINIFLLHGIGAAATIVPVIAWVIMMVTMNDTSCWVVYVVPDIQWVLDAPRLLMLFINVLLLLNILRILLTKLRRSENAHNLSTTKAMLFLMPLFGVQFLITAWRPQTTSCDWEQVYYFFTYVMDGLQAIMVAILYCYCNKEVHNLIRLTYKKTENVVSTRFRSEARDRRTTASNITNRRETFTTVLDDQRASIVPIQTQEYPKSPTLDQDLRTFTTFKPVLIEDFKPDSDPSHYMTVKSIGLLKDSYSGSNDGLTRLDFEYDESSYDNLRRSNENMNKITTPDASKVPQIKPRILRKFSSTKNNYQNFQVLVNLAEDQNNTGSESVIGNKCDTENKRTSGLHYESVYLNRPLHKNDPSIILPDVCNGIYNVSFVEDEDGNHQPANVNNKGLIESTEVNDINIVDTNPRTSQDCRYQAELVDKYQFYENTQINQKNSIDLDTTASQDGGDKIEVDKKYTQHENAQVNQMNAIDLNATASDQTPEVNDKYPVYENIQHLTEYDKTYDCLEMIDEIDANEIFDEVSKKYLNDCDILPVNPEADVIGPDEAIYENVIINSKKLCPNRNDENDKIIFL